MISPPLPASSGSSFSPSFSRSASASSSPLPTSSTGSSPARDDETGIVARLLFQLEDQIDAAYATSALLNAALIDARRDRNLSAVVGQPIFRKAAAVTAGMSEVRGEAVEMHRLLEALGKRLGVETAAYGPTGDKPNDFTVVGPAVG